FEDQRESSRAEADFQMGIDQSPRMTAQRKKITSAFGPAIQRKGASPMQKMKKAERSDALEKKPVTSSKNSAAPAIVQRDPGDEPIVEWMQKTGRASKMGYDLLCEQVEAGKKQIMMLEFYSGPVEDEDNSELAAAKIRIAGTSAAVREQIAGLPDAVSEARATAVGLAAATSIDTPHELLDDWSNQSLAAMREIALAQANAAATLVRIKEQAVKMASIAMGAGEIHMMRGLLKVADDSDAATASGDRVIADLNGDDAVASSGKEKAGLVTTLSDATNNAVTGVGFGVLGALEAGGVFSLSTASVVLGVIGGVLGLLFGAIGVFLGVKNIIRAKQSVKKLKDAKSKVSNSELEAIAEYAIDQKKDKARRNKAAVVGGLTAIGAGAIGLVALSVATFGLAAIVAGIGAALIGLGILGYRIIRNWRKRKAERKAFADQLIAEVQGGEEEAQARQIITSVGMDPTQVGQPGFRDNLAGKLKGYVKSKRTRMAEGLIKSLIAGKPSEVFDSELILGALGVDSEWVKAQVDAEKPNKAVSKVAGKLASW
ncbi:Dipeptide transport system permease protein DppC (TC 3.A.1.5.2), partial [hydrothermal vent metagenome]